MEVLPNPKEQFPQTSPIQRFTWVYWNDPMNHTVVFEQSDGPHNVSWNNPEDYIGVLEKS